MRWAGHVAHVVEHMQCLDRETWRKKAIAKPRRRWENNIKMGLNVIGRGLD
jgi:hypothetical protein